MRKICSPPTHLTQRIVLGAKRYVTLVILLSGLLWVAPLVRAQDEIQALFEAAQSAKARGDIEGAEQKYLELIRRSPGMAKAYHNLGIVYLTERKYHDAANVLEKAVKLEPNLSAAWFVQGLAYYGMYEPQKALIAFRTAVKLNPADQNASLYLGKSQLQMRDYRSAATTFEKLSQSRAKDPEVLYNLSLAHMKLMLDGMERLGAVAPHSYLTWLLLAQDAETRGDDQAAVRHYLDALRSKPEAVGVHYALGSIYARTDQYESAAEEFQKELKINANDSLALWKLGEITLRTSPREASGYLERALSLNPDLPQAALAYGKALMRLGESSKASEQFQRVVRLAPEEDSVHYHLAAVFRQLGRQGEANAELARFEELAKAKSERTREFARQEIQLARGASNAPEEPAPGFDPSREPAHD